MRHPNWRMGAKITVDSAMAGRFGNYRGSSPFRGGIRSNRDIASSGKRRSFVGEFRDKRNRATFSSRHADRSVRSFIERVGGYPIACEGLNKLHFYKMDYNGYPFGWLMKPEKRAG